MRHNFVQLYFNNTCISTNSLERAIRNFKTNLSITLIRFQYALLVYCLMNYQNVLYRNGKV